MRPSRRPLRGLLRMTCFLNVIPGSRHPEEACEARRLEGRMISMPVKLGHYPNLHSVFMSLDSSQQCKHTAADRGVTLTHHAPARPGTTGLTSLAAIRSPPRAPVRRASRGRCRTGREFPPYARRARGPGNAAGPAFRTGAG